MKTKMKITLAVLAVAAVCAAAVAVLHVYNESYGVPDVTPPETVFTDHEVIVFSEDSFVEEVRDILTEHTGNVVSFASKAPAKGNIALIDESWLTAGGEGRPSSEDIEEMLETNVRLIFVNGDSYLYEESGIDLSATTSVEGCLSYGIYYGLYGEPHLFVHKNGDLSEALSNAYCWAEEPPFSYMAADPGPPTSPDRSYPKLIAVVTDTSSLSEAKGTFDITAAYYKLMNFDDGYTYYGVHYFQKATPAPGFRLADIFLRYDFSDMGEILTTEPGTSYGDGNHYAGLFSIVRWSYPREDVPVLDRSRISTKGVNIWHDVSENAVVGLGYTAEPGIMFRVPNDADNGSLNVTDNHVVVFGERSFLGINFGYYQMHEFSKQTSVYVRN